MGIVKKIVLDKKKNIPVDITSIDMDTQLPIKIFKTV